MNCLKIRSKTIRILKYFVNFFSFQLSGQTLSDRGDCSYQKDAVFRKASIGGERKGKRERERESVFYLFIGLLVWSSVQVALVII